MIIAKISVPQKFATWECGNVAIQNAPPPPSTKIVAVHILRRRFFWQVFCETSSNICDLHFAISNAALFSTAILGPAATVTQLWEFCFAVYRLSALLSGKEKEIDTSQSWPDKGYDAATLVQVSNCQNMPKRVLKGSAKCEMCFAHGTGDSFGYLSAWRHQKRPLALFLRTLVHFGGVVTCARPPESWLDKEPKVSKTKNQIDSLAHCHWNHSWDERFSLLQWGTSTDQNWPKKLFFS